MHMYCHSLTAAKNISMVDVPCEDTPEGHIGVWLTDLDIEAEVRDELISVLAIFFKRLGKAYKIYIPGGEVVTKHLVRNDSSCR